MPFAEQTYKIPREFRYNLEDDRVPPAAWAQGSELEKCIVNSQQVDPGTIFQQRDVKPTVQLLFGVQNHPYDARARCTNNWRTDRLNEKDISEYRRQMGWGQ